MTVAAAATVLLVGIATGAACTTIAWARVLRPLRARLSGWAAYLVSCPVCLGFWVSLALTALQGVPRGLSLVVAWWAAWGVSSLVAAALDRLAGEGEEG